MHRLKKSGMYYFRRLQALWKKRNTKEKKEWPLTLVYVRVASSDSLTLKNYNILAKNIKTSLFEDIGD